MRLSFFSFSWILCSGLSGRTWPAGSRANKKARGLKPAP